MLSGVQFTLCIKPLTLSTCCFSPSLFMHFSQCVFFGCLLEWSWVPLFMSALSVSAFAQILFRESGLLLFFKYGEENKTGGFTPRHVCISYQIRLHFVFTPFLWLREV